MDGVFLLLGTNMGDREENLRRVREILIKLAGEIEIASLIYESEAWGYEHQASFYNQVVKINTSLVPEKLLYVIGDIEQLMGRQRIGKWMQRIIDIDILYYNNLVIATDKLIIPHPQIVNRKFTLIPLVEIAPKGLHPKLKISQLDLLMNCKDQLWVKSIAE